MRTANRLYSLLMAIIMTLSTLAASFAFATPAMAAAPTVAPLGDIALYRKQSGKALVKLDGTVSNDFAFGYIEYKDKDGKTWPAYCHEPNRPGVGELGGYTVTADDLLNNIKVYGAIVNGWPFKTLAEIGVNSEMEAYYVTKLAIWSLVYDNYSDSSRFTANGAENEHIITAYKNLLDKANATTSMDNITLSANKIGDDTTSSQIIQTFKVTSSSGAVGGYTVDIVGTAPSGTIIQDINGDTFKVVIPLANIPDNSSGSFNLRITSTSGSGNALVYEGVPKSNPDGRQNYAVAYESQAEGSAVVNYSKKTEEEHGFGKLRIVKKEAGTLIPLSGAEIKLTKADGGVYDIRYTDANGEVLFDNLPLGTYYAEEITPPKGHLLDVTAHKDIVIIADMPQQTITFENQPTPKIKIVKLDALTAKPIPGVEFLVSLDGGSESYRVRTDANGEAVLGDVVDLKPGTYTVKEVAVPVPYYLDPNQASKIVKLEPGKTASVSFTNYKKSTWRLWKYIEGTSILLDGAEFSITKKGTGVVVWEGIVEDGFKSLDGLEPNTWYTVTEMSAPDGYLIPVKSRDLYLEPGKDVDIKFDNRKRPELEIVKMDEKGNPLPNALFQIKKADGATVFEKMTDEDGRIYIPYNDKDIKLEEGVYSVKEIKAPDGFVLDVNCLKNVTLEWGQKKTLTFTNTHKPGLEIMKVDEETKLPLAGAKFRIVKTEDKTIREEITGADGRIKLENLDPGIYSVEEIVAPSGYLLEPQHKDIKLEAGEFKQLVYTNKARPKLRILKIDVVTGKPLANAEFRVTTVEDRTVSEYVTDETGVILIENLDEAIYKVEEFMAPEGYLLLTESKEIMTEWGITKTLKFDNIRKPTLVFLKTNGLTGKPVPGATFKVEYEAANGGLKTIGSFKTDANGQIIIPKALPGWYVLTETMPAPGYSKSTTPIRMYLEAGQNAYLAAAEKYYTGATAGSAPTDETVTPPAVPAAAGQVEEHSGSEYYVQGEGFNWPLNSVVIKKTHAITGELLAGAAFELYRADEQVSGVPGTNIGRYTTDHSGVVVITGLEPGFYIVKEVQAPQNFLISENSQQNGFLKPDGTTVLEFTFANYPYGGILITKVEALTGTPLAGAKFKVTDNAGTVVGNTTGEYVTDSKGEILIPNVKPGSYIITEIQAPANYAINTTPKTIQVGMDGKTYKVSFDNYPYGALVIKKYDDASKAPLSGAEFKVTASSGEVVGASNGVFTTDATGTITIPNLPKGSYVVEEIKAPAGYILENQAKTIAVEYGKTYTLDFYNKIKSGLQIIKIDAVTKQPLKDAKFTVYHKSGVVVGEYVTDKDGLIIIDNLAPGWYKAVEAKSPNGYILDDVPKDFEVTSNQFIKLTFENKPLAGLQIKKISEIDDKPLGGAQFKVTKQNGEFVGEYTTDANGFIGVPELAPGWYVIAETKAPEGFILDNVPKTVEVKTATPTVVTFTNKPLAGLQIKKLDSVTRQPIQGAEFTITKMNGERVGSYKTDKSGLIFLPELESGWYVVAEVKAAEGYILDAAPRNIEIKWGKPVLLEIENTPMSGILILKTDANTGKPLSGVKFQVAKANGERVGLFTTDQNGRIYINDVSAGKYVITETEALKGYELDTKVYEVTVRGGRQEVVEIKNKPLGGLRLLKIDSMTKKPIYDVEFMVFDENKKVVGTYYTDNNGVIDFSATLTEGRYTIRETRAAAGYYLDEIPKTVEFVAGKVTEIVWTNVPQMGQIQLIKKSGDDNEVNGLPAGTPLEGAIFEVYAYKSGNLMDRFVSGSDGRAVSKTLPLGRYIVKEVQAPQYYKLSDKQLDIDIEFATQIIKQEFVNYSANTGVYIKKVGNIEAMPGDTIRYDIKAVQNVSTVSLTDFYWRDVLPVDAVRLNKIVTGSYNQSLKYKIIVTTNKGDTRIIADNLSTTKNNVIDCSPASLGLKNDEFVTSFTLIFGTVKAGFAQVEQPQIYVNVLKTLPNGYQFSNKADVGGKYGREWVLATSTTVCTIFTGKPGALPRTGY